MTSSVHLYGSDVSGQSGWIIEMIFGTHLTHGNSNHV